MSILFPEETSNAPQKERLVEQIMRSAAVLNQRSMGSWLAIVNESGLTIPQLVTLHVVGVKGPLPVCEIADLIHLSRAATSHLVDRLVRRNLVKRTETAKDRRLKRVSLQSTAKELLERLLHSRMESLRNAVEILDDTTCERFGRVLDEVVEQMQMAINNGHEPASDRCAREQTEVKS